MAKIIHSKWASNQDLDELKKKMHQKEQTDKVGNEVVGLIVYKDNYFLGLIIYKDCNSH